MIASDTQARADHGPNEEWIVRFPDIDEFDANAEGSQLSFASLALGRRALRSATEIRPRPELLRDLMPALRKLGNARRGRFGLQNVLSTLTVFWAFLNAADDDLGESQDTGLRPFRLFDIPIVWEKFSEWLSENSLGTDTIYYKCRAVLNLSADLAILNGSTETSGFPLKAHRPEKGRVKRAPVMNAAEAAWILCYPRDDESCSWKLSFADFALGRPERGSIRGFRARPELTAQVMEALRSTWSGRAVRRITAMNYARSFVKLWHSLDSFEESSVDADVSSVVTTHVAQIPGPRWKRFRENLGMSGDDTATSYSHYCNCKYLLDIAARLSIEPSQLAESGFPLPPNPFSLQKATVPALSSLPGEREFTVRGHSALNIGHGIEHWELVAAALVLGRPENGAQSSLTPRPSLGREVIMAMQEMVMQCPMERASAHSCLGHLSRFWKFLDEMSDAAKAAGEVFPGPESVPDVPGIHWTLFKDWLAAGNVTAYTTYYWCKRVFEIAIAQRRIKNDVIHPGFPLPPNPFPNSRRNLAHRPPVDDCTVSLEVAHAAAQALLAPTQKTMARMSEQRAALLSGSERGLHLRRWLELAEQYDWYLHTVPSEETALLNDALGIPDVGFEDIARVGNVCAGFWLFPTRSEVTIALALILMRTGWNISTTLDIDARHWWEPHPTNSQVVRVFSRKLRAKGAIQESYCNKYNEQHAFKIVEAFVESGSILRGALNSGQGRGAPNLRSGIPRAAAPARTLATAANRVWLFLSSGAQEDRRSVACLDAEAKFDVVNEVLERAGVLHRGKPLRFAQEVSRATWACYGYEVTGYNLLVTQIALGHRSLSTLLSYINQRAIRNKHRREFFKFQTHVLEELGKGRSSPWILRALVEKGELTDVEAEFLASGGARTRHGIKCANPYEPDATIDPDHVEGKPCATMSCLNGCSKAFATLDTLEYIAQRIIYLRTLHRTMPLLAWTESEHPHDLDFLEQIADCFSEENRRGAFEAASRSVDPPIYTMPSKVAFAQTRAMNDRS